MFRFENPYFLYFLVLIPILTLVRLGAYRQQKKKLKRFGDLELIKKLTPDVSLIRPWVKFFLSMIALIMLIVMVARPQMGTKVSEEKRNGIETMIAVDISNSMRAEDVVPSRLEKSKMLIEGMVDHFTNDKVGLIVFAGDAFIQLPITSDYVSAKMFLQNIDPALIASQGTNIGEAIRIASNSFTQDENVGQAIIVVTDGEDHEKEAVEAAENAKKKGMRVFVLGVGSTKGVPIPDGEGDYIHDRSGNVVMSALNEQMCEQIAEAGGGAYIHVDNTTSAQKRLDAELDKLQKGEISSVNYSEYDEQFQAFGILALLFLIIEICVLESRNPLLKNVRVFKKNRKTMVFLLMVVSMSAVAQNDRQFIREGNKLYRQKQYAQAEVLYRKAAAQNAQNQVAVYNLGCALMMQQKDSAAVAQFEKASKQETTRIRKSKIFHNVGVICQNHQMYGDAIKAYEESLRNNPKDDETRYNLALCKKMNKEKPQQQKKENNKEKKEGSDKKKEEKKNEEKQKQQQQDNPQMSQENAEQLLNAAIQNEKATQQRMKKAMQQPKRKTLEKNW